MSNKIEKGSSVTINSIDKTEKAHGLDGNGNMRRMVGGTFKVAGIDNRRLYISESSTSFQYTWHIDDICIVDEKEPEPIIFKFDEKQLIV